MSQWYDKTAAQTLAGLESGRSGLSPQEAQARLDKYGPNQLAGSAKKPLWARFLDQMRDPMILVLLAAAALSLASSGGEDWVEAVIILVIVAVNACISISQEDSAEKALEALELLLSFGFACVNVDFIYGIPGQQTRSLLESLKKAVSFGPQEIFLYPLYIKHGAGLEKKLGAGMVLEPENAYSQYREASSFLRSEGYRQDSMRRFVRCREKCLGGGASVGRQSGSADGSVFSDRCTGSGALAERCADGSVFSDNCTGSRALAALWRWDAAGGVMWAICISAPRMPLRGRTA